THVEPLRRNQTRAEERGRYTNHQPRQHEIKCLAQNHPRDVAAASTERHAYADLVRATCDAVGHHAIQTDAREDQSEGAEEADELRDQTILVQRVVELFVKRRDAEDGQLVVDLIDHLPHLVRERRRIRRRANVNGDQVSRLILNLEYRAIDRGLWLVAWIV